MIIMEVSIHQSLGVREQKLVSSWLWEYNVETLAYMYTLWQMQKCLIYWQINLHRNTCMPGQIYIGWRTRWDYSYFYQWLSAICNLSRVFLREGWLSQWGNVFTCIHTDWFLLMHALEVNLLLIISNPGLATLHHAVKLMYSCTCTTVKHACMNNSVDSYVSAYICWIAIHISL